MLKDLRNLLWITPLVVVVTLPLWKPLAKDILSPARRQNAAAALSLVEKAVTGSSVMDGVEFDGDLVGQVAVSGHPCTARGMQA